ncbi:GNAT family N-acetyltransferase [Anaerococcus sp. NML200537]|uniref:GNAT family N-acetyltransferase n=1 Tax=Anaerococcus sp. NML200537 TaxID=2954485 RepID=UPI002238EBB1|nr:GNAT family N-acetyltransferase [Anaerococcus sp. NML200537]MCW6700744.1 GNAT family N-acetyltransferase [Anaerococcus sp. NML200537]
MKNINLCIPKEKELDFAKNLLKDPATMAYNKGYDLDFPGYNKETGTINLDDTYLEKWYDLYFTNPGEYFYAYIYDQDLKVFVGDVNFHPSKLNAHARDIGIVIKDEFRGQEYGKLGLKLLIKKAFSFDSIRVLHNDFEKERAAALKIHIDLGFNIIHESDGILYLELENK